ncbi:MAG TPA: lactate utilization protein [Anaerolineae bacterium]|nr:lactate utilization protein [Anaerolineae bacterium]
MTLSDGRETILARLAGVPVPEQLPSRPGTHHEVVPTIDWDAATLVERFVQALERLRVTWEIAESTVVARLTLATRLQEEGVKQVLSWTAGQLPIGGVLEALQVLGIATVTPVWPTPDTRLRPQDLEQRRRYLLGIEAITVGLTGADASFAATGTLLLNSGPGRPLLVSQLPRRHIVLLPASRIYPSLEHWLARRRRSPGRQAVPVTIQSFLTGPSRSADIEATPAFGIHGPSRLHVIVVQGG